MIFVTVGTHEQSFNRLIKTIDLLVKDNIIRDEVFIQTGYTEYKPKFCKFKDVITVEEMEHYAHVANIIITHGGPGSIMLAFSNKKVPIVVPRQKEFNEHVDNHQVKFTNKLEKENKIIAIYDIIKLKDKILNYDKLSNDINNNYDKSTSEFVNKFEKLCLNIF